ncbi:MAG TPA: transcriptional repressor [Candidatus Acetothermia bacterium]|nr:transcriptional repressor [Candidatus Acetothermia bacterium]
MDRPVELFEAFLRKRGLHVTGQRRAVVETVFALPTHFEAAELWAALRGSVSSAATVYRTLELLEQAGLVRRVSFGEAHAHYEHTWGREDHGHLVCRSCGRVIEFADPSLTEVVARAAARHGFHLSEAVIQGYGLCQACRGKRL